MSTKPLARAQNLLQSRYGSEQGSRREGRHPAWVHRFRTVGRILFNSNEELYGRGSQFTTFPAPRARFCSCHTNHAQRRRYTSSPTSFHYRHHQPSQSRRRWVYLYGACTKVRLRSHEKTIEFGKKEKGSDYYGTLMFMVIAVFSQDPMVSIPIFKYFSIDKSVASARVIHGPWWPPLRHILENGKKMKFCCRKIEGGCCCGGWVHEDAMKGDAWR